MGFKSLIIGLILAGLFAIALLNFGTQVANDNPSNNSLLNSPDLVGLQGNLTGDIGDYTEEVNGSQESFAKDLPIIGSFVVPLESVTTIWKSFTTIPKRIYNLIAGIASDGVFGGAGESGGLGFAIIFTTVGTIIVFLIIVYAYKWIKQGEPD